MLGLFAHVRPSQVVQAVVGRIAVDVVDSILIVPLRQLEGDRDESVQLVALFFYLDLNVAAFGGFGCGDHAPGRFKASK